LLLNIIMIMPASQNRSNCAFRCSFLRLVTKPTAKSGLNTRCWFLDTRYWRKYKIYIHIQYQVSRITLM
jgi:hypothetical protein